MKITIFNSFIIQIQLFLKYACNTFTRCYFIFALFEYYVKIACSYTVTTMQQRIRDISNITSTVLEKLKNKPRLRSLMFT